MRKISICLLIIIVLILTFCLASCNKNDETIVQDTSPITISAPLNSRAYFLSLEKLIEENTGIQIEIEWEDVLEHTQYTLQKIENGNASDIVFSPTDPSDAALQNNFVDLTDTDVAKLFSTKSLKAYSVNKCIYMLPMASTIYGITYNKTLFNEKGWSVPTNYTELVALKTQIENAGCNFSSTILSSMGDGFNYLTKLVGASYLSTFDGQEWLDNFLTDDSTSIDFFSSSVDYLYKLNELGFFGTILPSAWDSTYTNENRCAFFIGNLAGSQHYVNETLGIDDEYGLMPFFDENGYSKTFVVANNTLMGINKSLEAKDKQEKLAKAKEVLKFIASNQDAINLTLSTPASYVSSSYYNIDKSKMYYDFKTEINNGYVTNDISSKFDVSVINAVSPLINNYLNGETVTKQEILTAFKTAQHTVLTSSVEIVGKMGESLTVKQTAEMNAKAAAIEMQRQFDSLSVNKQVQVSLVPYAESLVIKDLLDTRFAIRFKAQKDELSSALVGTMYSSPIRQIVAIELTGASIKALQETGYDSDTKVDTNTVHPWLVVTKNNMALNDNEKYVVAIPKKLVSAASATATALQKDSTVIQIEMKDAMANLFKSMDTVYLKNIAF